MDSEVPARKKGMRVERTLIVVKPDGVMKALVGEILSRCERAGLQIKMLKMLRFSTEMAAEFYMPHKNKHFYSELVDFITSGPVVAAILEGDNAVQEIRRMIGATDPAQASPGTIRKQYGADITHNVIHAADSPESFSREAKVVFPEEQLQQLS